MPTDLHFICQHQKNWRRVEGNTFETGDWHVAESTAEEAIDLEAASTFTNIRLIQLGMAGAFSHEPNTKARTFGFSIYYGRAISRTVPEWLVARDGHRAPLNRAVGLSSRI